MKTTPTRSSFIPLARYQVTDRFWLPLMDKVHDIMIPYQWEALNDWLPGAEKSGCIRNFRIAAGLESGEFHGMVFQDSDLYKWLEAVAYALQTRPEPALEHTADAAIDLIAAAQQPDGYLNTYYTITGLERRFTNLRDNHELYCAGHLFEAAVAYHQSTGKEKLLQTAMRMADCIDAHFGPGPDKLKGYPGHELIEMALVGLARHTGRTRYLELARFFVNQRGQTPLYFSTEKGLPPISLDLSPTGDDYRYWQANLPVRLQTVAEGHAVRAVYLYSGICDVALETGDEELLAVARRLWDNITRRQMYITGGIGATRVGESFTFDYDLPNDTAYAETCASVGMVFLAGRLLQSAPSGPVADVMERVLYNGVLSGVSLDAKRFFYVNPLEVNPEACAKDPGKRHVKPVRQPWFTCACCPPNLARLVASVARYACTEAEEGLFLHLYVGGSIQMAGGALHIESALPREGNIRLRWDGVGPFPKALALRLPGWCAGFSAAQNGVPVAILERDGYLYPNLNGGDTLELSFSMPVLRQRANIRVRENIGKIALTRGPLVYCLEEADNGPGLHRLYLPANAPIETVPAPTALGEAVALACKGVCLAPSELAEDQLYNTGSLPAPQEAELRFVPYPLWGNRGEGEMTVWVKECP